MGCSRMFGLGSRVPWDSKWVIESLSDSTIYMAYYTVAHYLQGESNFDGSGASPAGIAAEDMTDAVWDFLMLRAPLPAETKIRESLLAEMRREFEYWYPMDMRVSGKDLIGNHLTMSLYNHAEVWKARPELWPRSMYCNGHVLLDGEKMSKSTGNFLQLSEAIEEYGVDATRFACAVAGDSLLDANFSRKDANQTVSDLFNEEEWCGKALANGGLREGDSALSWVDRAFSNEVASLCRQADAAFEGMRYRDGMVAGWYELRNARDFYVDYCRRSRIPMHAGVVRRYVDTLCVVVAPVCPHFAQAVWQMLGHTTVLATEGRWPALSAEPGTSQQWRFLVQALKALKQSAMREKKPFQTVRIFVSDTYVGWKLKALAFLREQVGAGGAIAAKQDAIAAIKAGFAARHPECAREQKNVLQFASFMHDMATEGDAAALADTVPFDQAALLRANLPFIKAYILEGKQGAAGIVVGVEVVQPGAIGHKQMANAQPGRVSAGFEA